MTVISGGAGLESSASGSRLTESSPLPPSTTIVSANRAPNPLRCSEANKARRGSAYGTKELTTSLSVRRVASPQRGGGTQERLLRGI